jgi:pilus assembly protein Flp/PilA
MLAHLRRVARRATSTALDRGASAVEYGLMVAAISAIIVGTVFGLGTLVKQTFTKTCSMLAVGPASLGDPAKDCGAPAGAGGEAPPADPGAGE